MDKRARQVFMGRSVWFTVPGTFAILALAYVLVPPMAGMEDPAARLVMAVRWLPIAMIPYAAVCLWILFARFVEGAHNPLSGAESERLKIHCRVMQNTLEQLVWFVLCLLPLAVYLPPSRVHLVPIACVFFACARLIYWWGYLRSGTLARAPGVQMTFSLNIAMFVLALAQFFRP